jgi:uncharacterized protein YhfF
MRALIASSPRIGPAKGSTSPAVGSQALLKLHHDSTYEQEPLEYVGEELVVVDDEDVPVAVLIVVDAVEVLPLDAVG